MLKPIKKPTQLVVFISSTFLDLESYRAKVEEALQRIETSFRSMKYFGSKEGEPLDLCMEKVRESNCYIGIIGHRYGYVHEPQGRSITELEYEEAKSKGMIRRIYLADPTVDISPSHIEPDKKRELLDTFKQRLKKENTVVFFSSPEDLAMKVVVDVTLSLSETQPFTEFASDKYTPALRRTCASISFLGLDIHSMKRHKDVKIERVYVENRFTLLDQYPEDEPTQRRLVKHSHRLLPKQSQGLTIDQLLDSAPNIVILGDPGSGKTTLGKFLVIALSDRQLAAASIPKGTIAIRVPLRSYAEYRQRSCGMGVSILDFMEAYNKTELQLDCFPQGFFQLHLDARKALVLFDGLDEIFDAHLREQVRNDILSFAQVAYPGNKILVTSRMVGYEEAGFPEKDFLHCRVEPFEESQISEYVEKWYKLEETDSQKRTEEISAFERARRNLPGELLSNPLLLSLIVILFRAGCTLPESKLEIYRSCVGTLTEKWDASGKRLELPPEYNLVRDKKGALARIAYWMYKQLAPNTSDSSKTPKYADIVRELTRFLCEREFKARESEADNAARHFLDYAAKRSIFVEDRFSHKTFHEYFAALYLYRDFCHGHTPDQLYSEIEPYLESTNWAVVLELLFMLLDEQAASLLETILERITTEVISNPEKKGILLVVPVRVLGQLQNISQDRVNSLISSAVGLCTRARVQQRWGEEYRNREATTYQQAFSALEVLPTSFKAKIEKSLRDSASQYTHPEDLLSTTIFCNEYRHGDQIEPEHVIPNWETIREKLPQKHLSVFYPAPKDAEDACSFIRRFASYFGTEHIFDFAPLFFHSNAIYTPAGDRMLQLLMTEKDLSNYDKRLKDLLEMEASDQISDGMTNTLARIEHRYYSGLKDHSVALRHMVAGCDDPRKYLFDCLIIAINSRTPLEPTLREMTLNELKRIVTSGSAAQRFYASLLLGTGPQETSIEALGLSSQNFATLQSIAERKRPLIHIRPATIRKPTPTSKRSRPTP